MSQQKSVTSKDGTPIAYWHSGQGPPLVLVHGTGSTTAAGPLSCQRLSSTSASAPSIGAVAAAVATRTTTP